MNKLLSICFILLLLSQAAFSSPEKFYVEDDFLNEFVQLAEIKLASIEKQNLINEAKGESHLNQYVVYLNCSELSSSSEWAGSLSASLNESQLSGINNDIIKNFDQVHNKEGKRARFYVMYVDNFPVLVENDITITSYKDLIAKHPNKVEEMEAKTSNAIANAVSVIYTKVPELQSYQSWVAYTTGTVVGIKNEVVNKKVVARKGFFSLKSGGLREKSKCYLKSLVSRQEDTDAPLERVRIRVGEIQAGLNHVLSNAPVYQNFICPTATDEDKDLLSTKTAKDFYTRSHEASIDKDLVFEIAVLIDKMEQYVLSEYNSTTIQKISGISRTYYEDGWSYNSKIDYERYRDGLKSYIDLFQSNKIKISELTDPEKMLALAAGFTPAQKRSLSVEDKLSMLEVISKGTLGDYWNILSFSDWNGEFIANTIVESVREEQATEFLEGLLSRKVGDNTLFVELYKKMNNAGIGEENFTIWTSSLFKIWSFTDYSDPTRGLEFFTYGKDSPPLLNFKSDKVLGFYQDSFNFYFEDNKIHVYSSKWQNYNGAMEEEKRVGIYDLFQPVTLIDVAQDGKVGLPSKTIPLFYLKAFDDINNYENFKLGCQLTFDLVSISMGAGLIGQLKHLKDLPLIYRTIVGVAGGLEITSGLGNMIINHTTACTGSEAFCKELKVHLLWIQIASFSTGMTASGMLMLRTSASNARKLMPSKGIDNELVTYLNKFEDLTNLPENFNKYESIVSKLKNLENTPASHKNFIDNFGSASDDVLKKFNANQGELMDTWIHLDKAGVGNGLKNKPEIVERLKKFACNL